LNLLTWGRNGEPGPGGLMFERERGLWVAVAHNEVGMSVYRDGWTDGRIDLGWTDVVAGREI
jgi:hypothetical protein